MILYSSFVYGGSCVQMESPCKPRKNRDIPQDIIFWEKTASLCKDLRVCSCLGRAKILRKFNYLAEKEELSLTYYTLLGNKMN